MNQAQYAKHRCISQPRIAKLISQGKLNGAYKKQGRRYFINPIIADRLLEENRDPLHDKRLKHSRPEKSPDDMDGVDLPSASKSTLNEAARLGMWYRAALLKLKYERESGALISKEQVGREGAKMGAMIRTHLESLPAKIAAEVVGIKDPKKIAHKLRREIRSALTALSHEIEKL